MVDQHNDSKTTKSVETCGGKVFKILLEAGLVWLDKNHQSVNALNVFPVPDGDTGTNMLLTMRSAFNEVEDDDTDHVGKLAQKVAHGALMGARGNSGVILSQIWRGFARKIEPLRTFNAHQFATAVREASDTAYKGVVKPVEGTILTVARQAAEAAEIAAKSTDNLNLVLEQVVHRCHQAVKDTPNLLKVLADAGVVDAGGQGLTLILEGMFKRLNGESLEAALPIAYQPLALESVGAAMEEVEPGQDWEVVVDFYPFQELDLPAFYNKLEFIGTSIQFGEGDKICRMHIHLPKENRYQPIEYVETLGTVVNVQMENLLEQMEQQKNREPSQAAGSQPPLVIPKIEIQPGQIAAIAVAPGDGIAQVFESLGAAKIIPGGQTMNPSTEQIVEAIKSLKTDHVIVLPNNKNIIMAAKSACEICGKNAFTVPTRTIPEGVSALLVLDPDKKIEQVVEEMEEAAREVMSGEITIATRDVEMNGIKVENGHYLGIADKNISSAGPDLVTVVNETLEKMQVGDRELLTIYYGADVSQKNANAMAETIQDWYPDLDVEVVYGGQPYYYYIISAE
ncbi:MAG: DAK2 domain-containing protein [Anaerolineales bacterium]|nr:DAK2 domain-containing protein [Anaerolineales bacterium]